MNTDHTQTSGNSLSGQLSFSCPIELAPQDRIHLGHGGGGRLTQQLIHTVFLPRFSTEALRELHDGAVVTPRTHHLAITTDSYVVKPLFFPGGDIGSLAVYGSVNDLAMCGARPAWLSIGFILEEGLEIKTLEQVAESVAAAAARCKIQVVTGDTKVVEKGRCDGMYINTTAVGEVVAPEPIGPSRIEVGDSIILSGDIGRHGIAIMSVREGLEFSCPIESDSAPLWDAVAALLQNNITVHCLRDLTRGGLATVLHELAAASGKQLLVEETAIPVDPVVSGACEILGLDPLYVANEGRFIAIVPSAEAERAVQVLRSVEVSRQATIIGQVKQARRGEAVLITTVGAHRVLDLLSGEQLPRIC